MRVGSIAAEMLIIVFGGADTALVGLGILFALLLALTWRSLAHVDDSADIPIVAISLLRRIPAFRPMPPLALETVARAATEVSVAPGEVVVTEGEHGDLFYAVAHVVRHQQPWHPCQNCRARRRIRRGRPAAKCAADRDHYCELRRRAAGNSSSSVLDRSDRLRLVSPGGLGCYPHHGSRRGCRRHRRLAAVLTLRSAVIDCRDAPPEERQREGADRVDHLSRLRHRTSPARWRTGRRPDTP